MTRILRVDSSARSSGSTTRQLGDRLIKRLAADNGIIEVIHRDLAAFPPPAFDEGWIFASLTEDGERTPAQKASLEASDALVEEIEAADVLVIGVPLYNFAIPASLKAWVDLVARARRTFRYTENGSEGLLKNKKAYLVVASAGVPVGSDYDFATGYLRHVLGFLGITDVTIIAADRQLADSDALPRAVAAIEALGHPA